jgi:hypothetical protein
MLVLVHEERQVTVSSENAADLGVEKWLLHSEGLELPTLNANIAFIYRSLAFQKSVWSRYLLRMVPISRSTKEVIVDHMGYF